MKRKKKSLYEVKKAAVDDFMKVYDRGSRDDVFMYYNEVVDTTANMAKDYGREVGKYKGSFYGLLTGLGIVGLIRLKKVVDQVKKEKEDQKKMEEFIARHESGGEEST